MTISLNIKPGWTCLRDGRRLSYAMEITDRTLLFLPLNPADGGPPQWTLTEEEFEKELAAHKIKEFFVVRDANGDVVRDTTQIEIPPSEQETEKENRARSLFFFMKRWHLRKDAGSASKYHKSLLAGWGPTISRSLCRITRLPAAAFHRKGRPEVAGNPRNLRDEKRRKIAPPSSGVVRSKGN